jgi:SagB-type dehydrogenase family enzyme
MDKKLEREAQDTVLEVIGYHQETKHHFFRYARALGYMDWANQPNPFRRYEGAPLVSLPVLDPHEDPTPPQYDALYESDGVTAQPVTLKTLSRFFEYALALTAWKEAGGVRWALRSNPSSGNLHPTEGYLLIGDFDETAPHPALYHYAPKEHGLERRADCPTGLFGQLMKNFPAQAFLVGFTSIHWREAWKYGERAFRYCQHDAGHAIGSTRIAAATLGWNMTLLEDVTDDVLTSLLGLAREEDYVNAEREHPDCLAVVWPRHSDWSRRITLALDPPLLRHVTGTVWYGRANRLSRDRPDPWDIIDVVSERTWKSEETRRPEIEIGNGGHAVTACDLVGGPAETDERRTMSAGQVIRQRRSALAFDGTTTMSRDMFFLMLSRVRPTNAAPFMTRPMPWDAIPWAPAIHLALFVHRVDGIPPGLYCLVRHPAALSELRRAMHPHFAWSSPPGCPESLPLYFLLEGDARKVAAQVSCHQEIAGDGAFSLGMIAEFEGTLRRYGPWFYRRLFWETGVIGQVLYLEAEAAGLRATGIGCYFDDPVHQVFGLKDLAFQSLYHFTVGGHVDDPRLTTLPPYGPQQP